MVDDLHRGLFQRTQRHVDVAQLAVELAGARDALDQQGNEPEVGPPAEGIEDDDACAFADHGFTAAGRLETQQRDLSVAPVDLAQVPGR